MFELSAQQRNVSWLRVPPLVNCSTGSAIGGASAIASGMKTARSWTTCQQVQLGAELLRKRHSIFECVSECLLKSVGYQDAMQVDHVYPRGSGFNPDKKKSGLES